MASKRRRRRVAARHCESKRTYATHSEAWAVTLFRLAHGMSADVRPYRCPYCCRWHLGHELKPRKTSYDEHGQQRVPYELDETKA